MISSCKNEEVLVQTGLDYKQEMRNFVQEISNYAKEKNPDFIIIPQNGIEIVTKTGDADASPDLTYLKAIDGIGQEDLFYGYDKDNKETPDDITVFLTSYLDLAKYNANKTILVTDYCSEHTKMNHSYDLNRQQTYISFAADHRELDHIPSYPSPIPDENSNNITRLPEAKNFLYLINPDNEFDTKQSFIDILKKTNYDLIIIDFFFKDEAFTPDQIKQLKIKANGGKRLVISYLSIGQAEEYRYYWQPDWNTGNPSFIDREDPEWQGNYYVRYWDSNWKKIIFNSEDSYLNRIIDSGFDGVYLDIIDAYDHFE